MSKISGDSVTLFMIDWRFEENISGEIYLETFSFNMNNILIRDSQIY
jgi:hypothetical protein